MNENKVDKSSSDVSDSDDASAIEDYKTRISDLIATVSHLHISAQREKYKTECLQNANDSLRHARQTNNNLSDQIATQDRTILVLQNRLAYLGENTEIHLSPSESIVLPSKENFERILEENIELKKNLKYTSYDPKGLENLHQQLRTAHNDLRKAQQEIKQLQTQYDDLKQTLSESDDRKEYQLFVFAQKLEGAEKNTDVHVTLCQSLTDETNELKTELKQTLNRCQRLKSLLAKKPSDPDKILLKEINSSDGDQARKSLKEPQVTEPEQSTENLIQQENNLLLQKLQEVLKLNADWQKYNSEREVHVKSLQKECKELSDKLSKACMEQQDSSLSDQQQQQVDKVVSQCDKKLEEKQKAIDTVIDENSELRRDLVDIERSRDNAHKELHELRQNLQSMVDMDDKLSNYKEKVQLLEQQLSVYKHDFETERRDRANAVSKTDDLQSQLRHSQQIIEQLQRQLTTVQVPQVPQMSEMDKIALTRANALLKYKREYEEKQRERQFLAKQGFGVPYRYDTRVEADGDFDSFTPEQADEDTIGIPIVTSTPPYVTAAGATQRTQYGSRDPLTRSTSHHAASSSTSPLHHSNTTGALKDITKPLSTGAYDTQHNYTQAHYATQNRNYYTTARSDIGPGGGSGGGGGYAHASRAGHAHTSAQLADADTLQCPKCQMSFQANQHLQLLDHINDCV